LIIGKGGKEVDKLREELKKITKKSLVQINMSLRFKTVRN